MKARVYQDGQFVGEQDVPDGLGDKVARVATPIARLLRLNCIDKATGQPKAGTPCDKAKKRLNAGESPLQVLRKRLRGE